MGLIGTHGLVPMPATMALGKYMEKFMLWVNLQILIMLLIEGLGSFQPDCNLEAPSPPCWKKAHLSSSFSFLSNSDKNLYTDLGVQISSEATCFINKTLSNPLLTICPH